MRRAIPDKIADWDVDGLAKRALDGPGGVNDIVKLLRSDASSDKIRALTALLAIVGKSNWKTRKRVLENSLDDILIAVESKDPRVSKKALEVLAALLKNNPLGDRETSKVIATLLRRARRPNGTLWEGLMLTASTVRIPYVSDESTKLLTNALRSGAPEEAAVASIILLNSGAVTRDEWGRLVERISELLGSGDPLLVEAGLRAVDLLAKLPPVFPMDVAVKTLMPTLRKLIASSKDQLFKMRAIESFDRIKDTVVRYYRVRPEEARKTAGELLSLGLIEEAYMISSAAGFLPGIGLTPGNNGL